MPFERCLVWLLGALAALVGLAVIYGVLKDVVGLPMPWPAVIAAGAVLTWACWPSKQGGTTP